MKYIYEDNDSDSLIIVFSGFAKRVARYNYMHTPKAFKIDKLFILDDFGHRGSYYWFENGTDRPLRLTSGPINYILNNKGKRFKNLYTAGSSKGGLCALFYGLIFGADSIFAGACQYKTSACQYKIGQYLSTP